MHVISIQFPAVINVFFIRNMSVGNMRLTLGKVKKHLWNIGWLSFK